jgi:hypothetical protein
MSLPAIASLHSPAADQKLRPGLIVEAADLDDRTSVGGVVNKLSVTDIHSGVGNVARAGTKEEQVAGLQVFALDRDHASPCGLLIGVAGHVEAAGAHQHLREAGAVEAKARSASP